MSFIEDLWPWLGPPGFLEKYRLFKDSLLQSMANTSCGSAELKAYRDESAAFVFKLIVVASILLAVVVGVTIPLVSKNRSFLHTDGSFFVVAKAFAARVILATGFVHMLSKGSAALNDLCLPEYPWTKFPFSGFFTMMASFAKLLVDFVETQYYERKQGKTRPAEDQVQVVSDSLQNAHLLSRQTKRFILWLRSLLTVPLLEQRWRNREDKNFTITDGFCRPPKKMPTPLSKKISFYSVCHLPSFYY